MPYKAMQLPTPTKTTVSTDAYQMQSKMAEQKSRHLAGLADKLETFTQYGLKAAGNTARQQASDKAVSDVMNNYQQGSGYQIEDKSFAGIDTVYSQAYSQAATATYSSMVDIDVTKKSNELKEQHWNDPSRYSTEMKSYTESLVNNAPTPELQAVIQINGTKLQNQTAGVLTREKNTRIKQHQAEVFSQDNNNKVQQAISMVLDGQAEEANFIIMQQSKKQKSLIDDGTISPVQAEKDNYNTSYLLTRGVAIGTMEQAITSGDMAQATELIKTYKNSHDNLGVKENEAIDDELLRMYNNELKRQKAGKTANSAEANIIIGDATKVAKKGYGETNSIEVKNALSSASPTKQHEYNVAQVVKKYRQAYATATLAEQRQALDKFKGKENATREEVDAMDALETELREKFTAVKTDSQTIGAQDGLYASTIPITTDMDINTLNATLLRRQQNKAINQEHYGQTADQYLTKIERENINTFLTDRNVSVDDKTAWIANIASMPTEISDSIFNEVGTKRAGTYAFAGKMMISGNPLVAKMAIKGNGSDVALDDGFTRDLKDKLGTAFGGHESDIFNQHLKGITDYAKGLKQEDNEDYTISEIVESSVGEINLYNRKDTVLPPGVSENDFEDWLDDIEIKDRPILQQGLRDMTDFMFDGDLQLHYKAPGEYYIKRSGGGQPGFIQNEDKTPFVLKWGAK